MAKDEIASIDAALVGDARMAKIEAAMAALAEENAALRSQLRSIQTTDWPEHAEVQRQAAIIRRKSRVHRISPKKHVYQLRIAPRGKRGSNGEPVQYAVPFTFASKEKPQYNGDNLSKVTQQMVVAEYNASTGSRLRPEDVLVVVA